MQKTTLKSSDSYAYARLRLPDGRNADCVSRRARPNRAQAVPLGQATRGIVEHRERQARHTNSQDKPRGCALGTRE